MIRDYIAIASIHRNNRLVGYWILKTDSGVKLAADLPGIVKALKTDKTLISNLGLDGDRIIGTQGTLKRLPADIDGVLMYHKEVCSEYVDPVIILAKLDSGEYIISSCTGQISVAVEHHIKVLAKFDMIANAKLENINGTSGKVVSRGRVFDKEQRSGLSGRNTAEDTSKLTRHPMKATSGTKLTPKELGIDLSDKPLIKRKKSYETVLKKAVIWHSGVTEDGKYVAIKEPFGLIGKESDAISLPDGVTHILLGETTNTYYNKLVLPESLKHVDANALYGYKYIYLPRDLKLWERGESGASGASVTPVTPVTQKNVYICTEDSWAGLHVDGDKNVVIYIRDTADPLLAMKQHEEELNRVRPVDTQKEAAYDARAIMALSSLPGGEAILSKHPQSASSIFKLLMLKKEKRKEVSVNILEEPGLISREITAEVMQRLNMSKHSYEEAVRTIWSSADLGAMVCGLRLSMINPIDTSVLDMDTSGCGADIKTKAVIKCGDTTKWEINVTNTDRRGISRNLVKFSMYTHNNKIIYIGVYSRLSVGDLEANLSNGDIPPIIDLMLDGDCFGLGLNSTTRLNARTLPSECGKDIQKITSEQWIQVIGTESKVGPQRDRVGIQYFMCRLTGKLVSTSSTLFNTRIRHISDKESLAGILGVNGQHIANISDIMKSVVSLKNSVEMPTKYYTPATTLEYSVGKIIHDNYENPADVKVSVLSDDIILMLLKTYWVTKRTAEWCGRKPSISNGEVVEKYRSRQGTDLKLYEFFKNNVDNIQGYCYLETNKGVHKLYSSGMSVQEVLNECIRAYTNREEALKDAKLVKAIGSGRLQSSLGAFTNSMDKMVELVHGWSKEASNWSSMPTLAIDSLNGGVWFVIKVHFNTSSAFIPVFQFVSLDKGIEWAEWFMNSRSRYFNEMVDIVKLVFDGTKLESYNEIINVRDSIVYADTQVIERTGKLYWAVARQKNK